jgi:hypothetical protein
MFPDGPASGPGKGARQGRVGKTPSANDRRQ